MVYADEERLDQILFNLLDNAIKYTKCNGIITINSSIKNKFVEISITDTGCGIDKENWEIAFEPYPRLDKEENKYRGLGLGLAISNMLIELQGGTSKVDSKKGEGSKFSFTLLKYFNEKCDEDTHN
jgi:two-component system sensor histidine kinase ChiS